MEFKVVIPARYGSTRLPGKPLLRIAGKPMLEHVHLRALESGAQQVVIATDDERIRAAANDFGAQVCMTLPSHVSGSDRVAEVGVKLGWDTDTPIVNLQGDEPLMPAENIRQVAENLRRFHDARMATLCTAITQQSEFTDPNVVKVVRDKDDFALYFSRAPIPFPQRALSADEYTNLNCYFRHIGLYAYRLGYLSAFTNMARCQLESLESLEQLRALYHGNRIHVAMALKSPGPGIDTEQDLTRLKHWFESQADTDS